MSHCLLLKNRIIDEGDTIDIVFENRIIDFIVDPSSSKHTTRARISRINNSEKSFHIFLIDHGAGIHISTTGLKSATIVEKSKITNPNVLFKHRGYHDGQ